MTMTKKQIAEQTTALVAELAPSGLDEKGIYARIVNALPSRCWGHVYTLVLVARSEKNAARN